MAVTKHQPGTTQEIIWTDTGANTDVTPDTDTNINIAYATTIAIQVDLMHASNTSADWDTNVFTSLDGSNWDTVPYKADLAAADGTTHTFLVDPGARWLRLRGDQNTVAATGYVTARVLVIG